MPHSEDAPTEEPVSPQPPIDPSSEAEESLPAAPVAAVGGENGVGGENSATTEEDSQPAEDTPATATTEAEEQEAEPLSKEKQEQARTLGRGIWLALVIGAVGLMVTLLLPWAQVYYLNPLQPLEFADNGAIQFTRDEVIHVNLRGFQLLTLHLVPLLFVFLAAILLFGAALYWRQTHFLDKRISFLVLCLGLLVGVGFPVELLALLNTSQQVDWNNSHATIEPNKGIHDFSARDGTLYLCTPLGRLDPSCDNDYSQGIILNAGIDWVEINGSTGKPLIHGHAQSTRPSSTSLDVTSSGYALGPLGLMNPSPGYWLAWILSVWTLLSALALANRLRKTRKKQTSKYSFIP
ncbi:MAG TPA: hypothetical protein VH540_19775 [Ktedonobacterales bacterium]|jgi:hypothetical protein